MIWLAGCRIAVVCTVRDCAAWVQLPAARQYYIDMKKEQSLSMTAPSGRERISSALLVRHLGRMTSVDPRGSAGDRRRLDPRVGRELELRRRGNRLVVAGCLGSLLVALGRLAGRGGA